jgi:hypothetical protein
VNTKDLYNAMLETCHEEAGCSRGYFVLSNCDEAIKKFTKETPSRLECQDCSRKCHVKA